MYNAPRASVLWFFLVLMLSVYTWGYFWPAYIRRSDVCVPAGSGRHKFRSSQDLHWCGPYEHNICGQGIFLAGRPAGGFAISDSQPGKIPEFDILTLSIVTDIVVMTVSDVAPAQAEELTIDIGERIFQLRLQQRMPSLWSRVLRLLHRKVVSHLLDGEDKG